MSCSEYFQYLRTGKSHLLGATHAPSDWQISCLRALIFLSPAIKAQYDKLKYRKWEPLVPICFSDFNCSIYSSNIICNGSAGPILGTSILKQIALLCSNWSSVIPDLAEFSRYIHNTVYSYLADIQLISQQRFQSRYLAGIPWAYDINGLLHLSSYQ